MSKKSMNYNDYMIETLKDPVEAAACLNAALAGGDIKVFLLALHDVVRAQGGIAALAEKTSQSRTSLYKALSESGNPYLKNIDNILSMLGMKFTIVLSNNNRKFKRKAAG